MKKTLSGFNIFIIILSLSLHACDFIQQDDNEPEVPLEADVPLVITVQVPTVSIRVGETHQANYLLMPDTMVVEDLEWTSSNPAVAKVSSSGLITALALGHADIKISSAEEEAEALISVDVVPTPLNQIILEPDVIPAYIDESKSLAVTFDPADATDKSVIWETSDNSVVSIDQTGRITAKKLGYAWITVYQSAIADNAVVVPAFKNQQIAASQINSSGEKNFIHVYVAALEKSVTVNEAKLYLGIKGDPNSSELKTVRPALSLSPGNGGEIAIEVNDEEANQLTFGKYVRMDVSIGGAKYFVFLTWMNNIEIVQQ